MNTPTTPPHAGSATPAPSFTDLYVQLQLRLVSTIKHAVFVGWACAVYAIGIQIIAADADLAHLLDDPKWGAARFTAQVVAITCFAVAGAINVAQGGRIRMYSAFAGILAGNLIFMHYWDLKDLARCRPVILEVIIEQLG